MKEYKPKELKVIDSNMYEGIKEGFVRSVKACLAGIETVLRAEGGALEHGSFFRMMNDLDEVVYAQCIGMFMMHDEGVIFGLTKIYIYDDADEYTLSRIALTAESQDKFGDDLHGVPTVTNYDINEPLSPE